jgi:hypothetical protein
MRDPCGICGEGPGSHNQKPWALRQKPLRQTEGLMREVGMVAEAIGKELESLNL